MQLAPIALILFVLLTFQNVRSKPDSPELDIAKLLLDLGDSDDDDDDGDKSSSEARKMSRLRKYIIKEEERKQIKNNRKEVSAEEKKEVKYFDDLLQQIKHLNKNWGKKDDS